MGSTTLLAFRLPAEQLERLRAVASAHALTANEFARRATLREIGVSEHSPPVAIRLANGEEIRKAMGEFGRQGSNLNQIARALNAGQTDALVALTQMTDAYLEALSAIRRAILGEVKP